MTCTKDFTFSSIVPDWTKLHWIVSNSAYVVHANISLNGIFLPLAPPPAVPPFVDVGTQDNLEVTYAPNGDVFIITEATFAYGGPAANCRMRVTIISGSVAPPDHIISIRLSNDTDFFELDGSTSPYNISDLPLGITDVDFVVPDGSANIFASIDHSMVAIGAPAFHYKVSFMNI